MWDEKHLIVRERKQQWNLPYRFALCNTRTYTLIAFLPPPFICKKMLPDALLLNNWYKTS